MPRLEKDKYENFCQHYFISHNATKSAIAAGYSEKSAYNQGYELLKRPEIQERIEELSNEVTTDVDVISELEKQYEQAKINGHGQTALKALELLSRVRGNNQEDAGPVDMEALEDRVKNAMYTIGKEKMFELFLQTFPEIFEEEEQLEAVEQVMEEDRAILEQLDD
jgi:phage terminase small subunit